MDWFLTKFASTLLASLLTVSGGPIQPKPKPAPIKVVKKSIKRPIAASRLRNAISEMERVGNMFIGGDHYAWLARVVAEAANDPLVRREDLERARRMLGNLNYDSGSVRKSVATGEKRDEAAFALRDKFMHLESEVRRIIDSKIVIGHDHFTRLNQGWDELSASGAFKEGELSQLRQLITSLRYYDKESGTLQVASAENCKNINELVLTNDITDFSMVKSITAPGADGGPQDKYKGHSFINTDHARVPVYAPVVIILESGSFYEGKEGVSQYILNFRVKDFCKVTLRFDHMTEPVANIKRVLSSTPKPFEDTRSDLVSEEITFVAGDLIGYTTGTPPPNGAGNWDFGLYNMSKMGPLGAMGAYGQHAYAVCSWDFYPPEKRAYYKKIMDGAKFVCDY